MTRHAAALACASLLLATGCAQRSPDLADRLPASLVSDDRLEGLREAALEFERARAAGDALAMARAAARRQPIDRFLAHGSGTDGRAEFLSAHQMFGAARAAAGEDVGLLRSIEELEAQPPSGLLDGFAGSLKRPTPPKLEEREIEDQQGVLGKGQSVPRQKLPAARLPPAGSVISVGPGKSVWMRADVGKQRTLFVYAETRAGTAVRLAIIDVGTGAQICVDSQAHGYLLCRWRTEAPATGVVALSNAGPKQAAVLLIAHQ